MRNRLIFSIFCLSGVLLAQQIRLPVANVEVGTNNLPAQRIGADDLIALQVYDSPEFTRTIRVGPDGEIRLPLLKQRIKAEGLMPNELEVKIAEALKQEQLIIDPFVTVVMVEYHSRPISVAGAVKKPLTFQAVGGVTLLDAITRAEGLSSDAGGEILISRPVNDGEKRSTLVQRIPVKGLIDAADPELNVKLTGGEEIRVPEVGKVFVAGNVKKPGAFPVMDASDTSVMKVIAMAGGLEPFANKQAFIYRPDDRSNTKNEIPIELKKIMDRKAPDVPLQARDILYIPDNSGRRVTVSVLERLAGFGSATASGVMIYRR